MDLLPPSMLRTPVSEYNTQRTGAQFTVRSVNSPSYSATQSQGVRKARSFSEEERESTVDRTHSSTNGAYKEVVTGYQARTGSHSSVKGQFEETSGRKTPATLNQNGITVKTITEFDTDRSINHSLAPETRGRAEWRTNDSSNRSKSLNWRTAASSPDRRKMADLCILSTKQGFDERRTGVAGMRARATSSIQAYNSAGLSNEGQESSPVSHTSQTLDKANWAYSLPTRLRSLSGPGVGIRGPAPSLGLDGGQSIMERIEKLYGSAGFGKMEDGSKNRDFSTPATSHHRETSRDVLIPPQQRSYDWASGGSFPRHFSPGERSSLNPVQDRKSFTWTQNNTDTSLSPGTSSTRERLSGAQWRGQIQGRYPEEGGVNWGRSLEEMGTRSLDRARNRLSAGAQIRSAGAGAGFTAPLHTNTFLEEERLVSLRKRSTSGSKDQGGVKDDDGLTENTHWKRSSLDENVFESNTEKISMKAIEGKRLAATSATSVRNKINQFEALTQKAQAAGLALMPRRTFSAPTQLRSTHDGVKKSKSAKAIGGLRYKCEVLEEAGDAGGETQEKGAGWKLGPNRSLSVDEVGLSAGRREGAGNDLDGKEGKETDTSNSVVDFAKYSRIKSTLEIPLNGKAQGQCRTCYIDGDEEASERPQSSLLSSSRDTFTGVQTTLPPRVASPVSDEDKTPTNCPNNSPTIQTMTTTPTENENTPIFTQPAKTPEGLSPPLPHPHATLFHNNLPDLISPDVSAVRTNGKKRVLDLDAWVAGLNPKIEVWNDDEDDFDDDDDDDQSTQRDEDSDSGESSVTVTSNMSQSAHKSFCVSLSDLCNFAGVDYESENDSDEWPSTNRRTASLSSDISALSCVSVMPSEELDRLLEDVRSVGDDALQDYDDVQVVVLHKDMGVGLGFSLAGGVDQNKPVTVHKVFHSGVAAQQGSIMEGDQVLSINGTALCGYAHWEALRVLRRAKAREMGVVVLRRGGNSSVCKDGEKTNNQGPTQTQFAETALRICVCLEKNSRDLGFSLEGGVDSNLGNRPLTVQRIFQGGPVEKVRPGDEIEEIEGISMVAMRRLEAWTLIRRLPPGPVDVVIRRPLKHLET